MIIRNASVASGTVRSRFGRAGTALAVAVAVAAGSLAMSAGAWAQEAPAAPQVSVAPSGDLRAQAIEALRKGDFDRGTALLEQAAKSDTDAARLAQWATEYEGQRQVFVTERRKQFGKAVDDVQKLVDAKMDEFVADFAVRAYVLAEDKPKFTESPLVRGIVERSTAKAQRLEESEQWVRAVRLYADLSQLEPTEAKWKEKLKSTTRRVRMLSLYAPDSMKSLRAEDTKAIEELDKIVPPATPRPATRPADPDGEAALKIDWQDNLREIKPDMVWESLIEVRRSYWRDLDFTKMMAGGLQGVRTVLTTGGLETTFPALADAQKKKEFLAKLDELQGQLSAATAGSEVFNAKKVYDNLFKVNKATLGLPESVLVYEFADAALAECDPFTNMIWPNDVAEFQKSTEGEFSGVGIQINSDEDGSLKVVSPIEDSPAFKAGVKAGDIITHVNGKLVKGITTQQAVRIITGPQGTKVTLTIKSFDGAIKDYVLTRDTIKVASLKGFTHKPGGGWDYMIDAENKIAYLRLTNFTKTSGDELEAATAELKAQGVRGIIFDLRYNPGGLLNAAIDVSNRFLDRGVIVSTRADRRTPQQPTEARARPDPDDVKIPLVVLVNQYSASASEIVSGALKDHGRAIVVGERSFGKGSVQMLFPVDGRSAYLKLTTSHYYLPSGRCLHREENSSVWGVDPDVTVEMTPEQMSQAQRARSDLDVLYASGQAPAPDASPTTEPAAPTDGAAPAIQPPATQPDAPKRTKIRSSADLIRNDNQLGAALLLMRLELNGVHVAVGTPAPGVAEQR